MAAAVFLSNHKVPDQPERPGDLQDQNGGETEAEVPVLRFVVEGLHTEDAAHTSAQQDGEKEGALLDTPQILFGPALVDSKASTSSKMALYMASLRLISFFMRPLLSKRYHHYSKSPGKIQGFSENP